MSLNIIIYIIPALFCVYGIVEEFKRLDMLIGRNNSIKIPKFKVKKNIFPITFLAFVFSKTKGSAFLFSDEKKSLETHSQFTIAHKMRILSEKKNTNKIVFGKSVKKSVAQSCIKYI